MSPKLPVLKGREILAALDKLGMKEIRRSPGSHVRLAHEDGRHVTVPDHGAATIGRGLLRRILHDAHISPVEFETLL
jgi:predicted RNA binding protein YcfA (HicA-like mRNA interferase family)